MQSWTGYAGRFLLPALLLLAAAGAWLAAEQFGSVEHAVSSDADRTRSTDAAAVAPVLSVRRVPDFLAGSSQQAANAVAIASLPPDPGGLSCVSVLVDGVPILELRSDRVLVPSYAQLLITGHAAIDILGPEFRYETLVLAADLPDANGRIFSSVYLVGGGDPVLMTLNYSRGFRPQLNTRTSLEDLAAGVAEAGVERIDGGVIAIERRYDQQRLLPGWPESIVESGIVGPLTALQLNDGFAVRASANSGVATVSEEPALLAADRFVDELRDNDVQVFASSTVLDSDEELPSLIPVARISSAPLSDIVFQMLAVNDATAAELVMKELGVAETSEGSTQAGGQAVQRVLQDQGVDVPVAFRDGSGLDPIGGTSCTQLATAADSIPAGHPTLDVLPSYGLPGVFDGRFTTLEVEADFRLVGGVAGDASGFVGRTVGDGAQVTIASIINRPGGPSTSDLAYQEALVETVDQLRPSISFESEEPNDE